MYLYVEMVQNILTVFLMVLKFKDLFDGFANCSDEIFKTKNVDKNLIIITWLFQLFAIHSAKMVEHVFHLMYVPVMKLTPDGNVKFVRI